MRGEVWFVGMPAGEGREQRGDRPAVVISEPEAGTVVIVPLTTNLQALKYPHTAEVLPTPKNGLASVSVALVFQMRAIDRSRLMNKVGTLEGGSLAEINKLIKSLLAI